MFNRYLQNGQANAWRCKKKSEEEKMVEIFLPQFNFSYISVFRKITSRRNGREAKYSFFAFARRQMYFCYHILFSFTLKMHT